MVRGLTIIASVALLAGCNSYDVRALKFDPNMKAVTVVHNPSVRVLDFENVMDDEFGARGIAVQHVSAGYVPKDGEYVVTYDARQSWDLTTYLSEASVRVNKDRFPVGSGFYHHIGGSWSMSLWKWQGTKAKMEPLYEELLQGWK